MKNSQVAMICATILAAALINAIGNIVVVQSLKNDKQSQSPLAARSTTRPPTATTTGAPLTVAMMPKSKGNAYFIACRKGAEEAARSWESSSSGTVRPTPTRPSKMK